MRSGLKDDEYDVYHPCVSPKPIAPTKPAAAHHHRLRDASTTAAQLVDWHHAAKESEYSAKYTIDR